MPPHCDRLILIANGHSDQAVIERTNIVGANPGWNGPGYRHQESLASCNQVIRETKETLGTSVRSFLELT